ncbi:MAG: M14 family metallocarboxypeptidase [Candidatus Coatesbacteria bacterium]
MPSFADLARRLDLATRALDGVVEEAGALEGYPFLRLAFGAMGRPAVLLDAGIHGEEPAGPLGLADWLEADAAAWGQRIRFTILPCLNPWGFERGTRSSRDTEDLNRHFDEPDAPLTRLVTKALEGERFRLAVDMHEDADFDTCYLYELKAAPPFAGERLLAAAAAAAQVGVSDGDEVGDFRTTQGLIRPPEGALRPEERRGWPIAIWHFAHVTGHTVTMETPGRRPLEARVRAHRAVLDAACGFVAGD